MLPVISPPTWINFLGVFYILIIVVTVNKKKYLVLDNQTGGRVALEYQKKFSSAIPYRQIHSNGHLDLSGTGNNVLNKQELDNYLVKKFEEREEAMSAVEDGLEDKVQGTSDILS